LKRKENNFLVKRTSSQIKNKSLVKTKEKKQESKEKEGVDMPKEKDSSIKKDKRLNNVRTNYQLIIDKAKVDIKIEKDEKGLSYNLFIPEIDVGTEALLEDVREDLIAVTTIAVGEIIDQKSITKIKKS